MTGQVSGAAIPERILVPSDGIETVAESPPGRVVAIVDAMDRYFAFSSDGVTVRELPEIADRCEFLEEALLSPDGSQLAISGLDDVYLLDLTTGRGVAYPVLAGGFVTTLAWSADGRRVACAVDGDLALLEVPAGRVRIVDLDGEETGAVAFSPDGSRLAVDLDEGAGLVVFDEVGEVAQLVSLPVDMDEELSGAAAWSPDGRLLAVELVSDVLGEPDEEEYTVSFVDVDAGKQIDQTVRITGVKHLDLAGWRTPTQPVFVEHRLDGIAVVVRDISGAMSGDEVDVLATASPDIFDVQLAAALLAR